MYISICYSVSNTCTNSAVRAKIYIYVYIRVNPSDGGTIGLRVNSNPQSCTAITSPRTF